MMASLGEGLSLASASGLDASALITILDQGAMSNPMFRLKGPKIIAHDHAPNFPLKHQSKVQTALLHR
jgi:3-hydroxyisobutyrate dehydrogenase-like beta-hydroxyacid dehydrogenase